MADVDEDPLRLGERLPIEGFYWGLKVYAEVVLDFLGLRFEDVFE